MFLVLSLGACHELVVGLGVCYFVIMFGWLLEICGMVMSWGWLLGMVILWVGC